MNARDEGARPAAAADPEPEPAAQPPASVAELAPIELAGWRPGDRLAWDFLRPPQRADAYRIGERAFEAYDLHCVTAGCACTDIKVLFRASVPLGAPSPGLVTLDGDRATLEPEHERWRGVLEQLWSAYQQRHPGYATRLADRRVAMRALAGRIVAAPVRPAVSRNAPCPCGSGKKHKQCCGAA